MLVSEIKKEITKYNKKDLEKIIIELYKRIPKNKKEDYNIDEYIKNINIDKKEIKKEISFEDLVKEITYFLQCVDYGYYASPNRVISKKDRSTWRFKVKKYYKELNNVLANNPNYEIANNLLIELFIRLSYGCYSLLFTNWETFRAIGVSQYDYYDNIVKRILYNGYTEDNMQKCVNLLTVYKDSYSLSYDLFCSFIANLKTSMNREMAIGLLDEKIKVLKEKLDKSKDNHIIYEIKEDINNFTECILEIYCLLNEIDTGIKYFHNNYIENNKEIKEYILLEKLEELNLFKAWITEYEKNMNSINYRDYLKDRYKKVKELLLDI